MHLISMRDLTTGFTVDELLASAENMIELAKRNTCDKQYPNSKAVLLFMEPSTRTQFSTEQAVLNLGMRHTVISGTDHTSITKGESFADTFRMFVGQGARIIAVRTRIEGAPLFGAKICQQYVGETSIINPGPIHIINCGDGRQWHPTQTALDMLTIKRTLGRLDNFKLGIVGDPSKGRTAHTLLQAFQSRPGMEYVFVAPTGFEMPLRYKHGLAKVTESDLLDALAGCDIVYVTRFQTERMSASEKSFIESVRHKYAINKEVLDSWQPNIRIMHPLPRVDEITAEISLDKRVIAFQQAELGIPARMAIIAMLLDLPYHSLDLTTPPDKLLTNEQTVQIHGRKQVKYFQPVDKGTVIDHIPPGQVKLVLKVLSTLGCLPSGIPRQTVQFVKSGKYPSNTKDVLLLHDYKLADVGAATIQAMFPKATINILPGDGTISKCSYLIPKSITGNAVCHNETCITNIDREAKPNFIFWGDPTQGHAVSCEYCGNPLWNN